MRRPFRYITLAYSQPFTLFLPDILLLLAIHSLFLPLTTLAWAREFRDRPERKSWLTRHKLLNPENLSQSPGPSLRSKFIPVEFKKFIKSVLIHIRDVGQPLLYQQQLAVGSRPTSWLLFCCCSSLLLEVGTPFNRTVRVSTRKAELNKRHFTFRT